MEATFEWDTKKASENLRKHVIGFPEGSTVFGDALSVTIPYPDHSSDEERFIIAGMSAAQRLERHQA